MKAWAPALVMLTAGFAGGYLFGSGESGPDATTALPGRDVEDTEPPEPPPDLATAEGNGAGPELATTADLAPLRAALDRFPMPEIRRGRGVITGLVKTDSGAPLPGAEVKLTPTYPPDRKQRTYTSWEDEPLEDVVRRTVARYRWSRQTRQEVSTGADGTFRFEGLTDTTHQVRAEHADYMIHPVEGMQSWQAKPGAKIEFLARAAVSVTVEILLPDGSVPEQAQVSFKSSGANWGTGWQPQNTTVQQKPGTYELVVTAGDSNQYKSEPQTVVLELGKPQSLTVHLTGRPVLRGNVLYPEGEAFQGTRVYLSRLGPGDRPDAARLKASSQSAWVHRGHRRGADFSFTDLSPGRYALGSARTQNGDIVVMEVVQVGGAMTEQDLVIPPLSREEYAIVHVLGPDGKPTPDVQVSTGYRHEGGSSSGSSGAIKRPDGSLWVLPREGGRKKDPGGEYFVRVTSTTYGVLEGSYQLGSRVELTLQFQPPGSVDVHVAGVTGTRHEGRVSVSVRKLKEGTRRPRSFGGQSGKLDASGRMTKAGLQPGMYVVSVSVTSERRGATVLQEDVKIGPGPNVVKLKLPDLMSVTILGGEGTVTVRTKRGEEPFRNSFWGRADADGRAVFDALPAGTYTAQSNRKKVEFTLPGPTEIELR